MAHLTKHQLTLFFDKHKAIDITFNKHIITTTRLIPSEISIKLGAKSYSCILNSSSMIEARIIIQVNQLFFEELNQNNKWVSLHFSFGRSDKHYPLTFFIKSKVDSFSPFNSTKPNLYLLNLIYSQRPPDDLIEILGTIIEMNSNARQRKNDRIDMSTENLVNLGMKSPNSILVIGNEKKSCIIRDISFFGAKAISTGQPDFFQDKEVKIVIPFAREPGNCIIDGQIIRCEPIKANDSFVLLGIHYHEERVALTYIKALKVFFDKKDKAAAQQQEEQKEEKAEEN